MRSISIGPLEFLGFAALVNVLARNPNLLPQDGKVVIRNDNLGACDAANRGRVYSSTMRCALPIVCEQANELGREVCVQHIATVHNFIADDLSRVRVSSAAQTAARDSFPSEE